MSICNFCKIESDFRKDYKYCSKNCRVLGKRTSDINIFDDWNQLSAYVMGLIWTDGNIYTQNANTGTLLDITTTDKDLMTILHDVITPTKKLYTYKPKKGNLTYSIKTRNIYIIDSLIESGLTEKKTYTLEWPKDLPEELESHFIRGCFDGDGCVFLNKVNGHKYLHVSITGIKNPFITKLFDKLSQFNPKWYEDKRSLAWQIKIYGKNEVSKFADYIYKDQEICLKRKMQIFLREKYLKSLVPSIQKD
jgi:hypothetical protein